MILCPVCGRPTLPPDDPATVVENWLAFEGLSIAQLKRHDRRPHMVETRRRVSNFLRASGWSFPQIGAFLDRDHTSIFYLLKNSHRDAV